MYMETKQENFKRVATNRTNKIITMIRSLGNLTNSSFYEYTDEQVAAMFEAIEQELEIQKETLNQKKKRNRGNLNYEKSENLFRAFLFYCI